MTDTRTIQMPNSLGKEKQMTLAEFLKRNRRDLRHLASSEADLRIAEQINEAIDGLLIRKFALEYELQTGCDYTNTQSGAA